MATSPIKRPLEPTLLYSSLDNKKALGSGAYGCALLGHNQITRSPLVFKVQPRITERDQKITEREAKVTKLVTERSIPHCVHYRDSYQDTLKDKPVQVLVTNLIRGQTLDQIIKNDSQGNLMQCVSITKQLIECLRGLIREKLTHFDLKPANLIYDKRTRQLSVLDFGGAIKLDEMPLENQIITPVYASPEILLGKPIQGEKCLADIWSVGCILFELYTGKQLIPSPKQLPVSNKPGLTPEQQKNYLIIQQNNYILQQIVNLIGKPSLDFLQDCSRAHLYFTKELQEFKTPLYPGVEPLDWRKAIRQTMEESSNNLGHPFDENECKEVIEVLNAMLQYPKTRVVPEALLKYDFFQYDISFEFDFGPYANKKIPIKITIFPSDISEDKELMETDAIQLDLNERVYSRCFHIGRDSADQYFISLETSGKKITQFFSLPGERYSLNIAPLIDQLLNPPVPSAVPEPKKCRKNLQNLFEKENAPAAEDSSGSLLVYPDKPIFELSFVDSRPASIGSPLK